MPGKAPIILPLASAFQLKYMEIQAEIHFAHANMFARPRPKKSLLPPPAKRRKTTSAIEEISFDFDARAEYLTGFHKRKVQRAKHAQEEAAKKAKEERIAARKQVRLRVSLGVPGQD